MVLVKAAAVPTDELQENMCVAAMRLDAEPGWVRLYPVPFRDLADESKFKKYQEVTVQVVRPRDDRRPESWKPIEGSIQLGETLGTAHGWSERRQRVARLGERTMCDLIERNRSGSGAGIPSLSVVRAAEPPELLITQRDSEQLAKWRQRADAITAQPSLFDNPVGGARPKFEPIPWRFRYHYKCLAPACNSHKQTIFDWEADALWRKVGHRGNNQELMRQKFVDQMHAPDRDSVLFVGNMKQKPWNISRARRLLAAISSTPAITIVRAGTDRGCEDMAVVGVRKAHPFDQVVIAHDQAVGNSVAHQFAGAFKVGWREVGPFPEH